MADIKKLQFSQNLEPLFAIRISFIYSDVSRKKLVPVNYAYLYCQVDGVKNGLHYWFFTLFRKFVRPLAPSSLWLGRCSSYNNAMRYTQHCSLRCEFSFIGLSRHSIAKHCARNGHVFQNQSLYRCSNKGSIFMSQRQRVLSPHTSTDA